MNPKTDINGGDKENIVSLGSVIRMPESSVDSFFEMLESVPGSKVVYRKIALYELYITAQQPGRVQ